MKIMIQCDKIMSVVAYFYIDDELVNSLGIGY